MRPSDLGTESVDIQLSHALSTQPTREGADLRFVDSSEGFTYLTSASLGVLRCELPAHSAVELPPAVFVAIHPLSVL